MLTMLATTNSNDSERDYQEDSNLVTGISGTISAPIVLCLLSIVVCVYRAYKTTFQRLILYHILIAFFCECSFILQIQINSPHPRWLCITAIYLYLYFTLSWYVYTTAVTNYLFLLSVQLFRANPKFGSTENLPSASVFVYHSLYPWHTCGYQFMMVPMKH